MNLFQVATCRLCPWKSILFCPLSSGRYNQLLNSVNFYGTSTVFSSAIATRIRAEQESNHLRCPRILHVNFHAACIMKEEEKSVIEKAVTSLKERKQQKAIDILVDPSFKEQQLSKPKPPLLQRINSFLIHYYHGFRLFGLEVKIACRLLLKTLRGQTLSRREQRQFRRTVGDVFRIVPFSVFVIIPFMEFLLPVYLWLFPNALPSTFQTKSSKEARKQKELKVKLQMAKFLQDTIEEMSVASYNHNNAEAVQKFAKFFKKIRTTGTQATTEEIIAFSKLFEDELTLNNLSYQQLQALCRLVLLPTIGSSAFLRFQLRMKMKQLEADDKMIQKEGVDSLTVAELQAASQARGMRALGMPIERLKSQLLQWLDLHLNKKISISFLLLSRALYLPLNIPTSDMLKATLNNLPENIVDEAEIMVASTAGETIDNRRKVSIIQQQETLIREEEREKMERDRERLEKEIKKEGQFTFKDIDLTKQTLSVASSAIHSSSEKTFSAEEIRELSQVVSSLKGTLKEEKETLREIKEDREEFVEDIANLAHECAESEEQLAESVASQRIGRKVEAMLNTIDKTLVDLEQEYITDNDKGDALHHLADNIITVEQLEKALLTLRGTSCEAKHRSLFSVLDDDHDGNIKLEEVAEVIEALANENTDINEEHIRHIKYLIKIRD